jgi:PAS domain S-box-containing protein
VIDELSREAFQGFRDRHPATGWRIESGILQMTIQRLRKTSDRFSYQSVFGNFIKNALEKRHEDLKVANQALLGANRFLRAVMNTSPDLVVFIDNDAKITLFNRGAERITGFTESEVRGHVVDTLFPSIAIEGLRRRLAASGGEVRNYEAGLQRKDGRIVPVNISAAVMTEEGETAGAVIAGQDLTEKKVLEEQVIQSEKLALLGQLAGEVVHEIKNPLQNIMMALFYLRQNLVGTLNHRGRVGGSSTSRSTGSTPSCATSSCSSVRATTRRPTSTSARWPSRRSASRARDRGAPDRPRRRGADRDERLRQPPPFTRSSSTP